jgi:hypothetical protein
VREPSTDSQWNFTYDFKDIDQVYQKTPEDKQEIICQAIAQQILDDLE